MYQVHVVDDDNRDLYEEDLDQHFRLRRDVFIGERQWRALIDRGGREIDQFDGPGAVYLLGIEPEAGVVCGSRLLPSVRPTLLSAVFAHLAEIRGIPTGPDVYEWTRLFVTPSRRESGALCTWAGAMKCAMLEYCLEEGIRTFTGVCETHWLPRIIMMGWAPRALGLPQRFEGMNICAFSADPSEQALLNTRAYYGFSSRSLVRRTSYRPEIGASRHANVA
jgi:acyl-homoserine lactone synthase